MEHLPVPWGAITQAAKLFVPSLGDPGQNPARPFVPERELVGAGPPRSKVWALLISGFFLMLITSNKSGVESHRMPSPALDWRVGSATKLV